MTKPLALVVDNNAIVLLNAVDIFEDAGFDVLPASDGGQAFVQLRQHADEILVAFISVDLPGSAVGLQLAQHIADTYPWVAILMTSSLVTPAAADMPRDAAFFPKPYPPDQIIGHARRALAAKGVDLL